MEDLTLPSVGASFKKMGVLYIHSLKRHGPFSKLSKIILKNQNFKKRKATV
jgi:hypothetical protein